MAREIKRLLEIFTRTDNRATHRGAVQHHIKDREIEFTRRQAVQHHRTAAAHHGGRLGERFWRHRRYQHAVRAAESVMEIAARIDLQRVGRHLRAEAFRKLQLIVINIHRRHVQPHRVGVLNRQMP